MEVNKEKNEMVNKDNKKLTIDKQMKKNCENVSPIPEWNENIQKIIVGYH